MDTVNKRFGDLSIASKLNFVLTVAIALALGLAGAFLSRWLGNTIEERSLADLKRANQQVVDMIDAYSSVLESSAGMLGAQFAASLPKNLTRDDSQTIQTAGAGFPVLRGGDLTLNNNFASVDEFTATTGAVATVFVWRDGDFYRISTSLKNDKNERAIGTSLGEKHPAFARLTDGKPYIGRATLFGREYMTCYIPLKAADGQTIGVSFIGIDFTQSLGALKQKIRALKIDETGYIFVLDAVKNPGAVVVHPAAEGKNLIETKDSNGYPFVKEMIEKKSGVIRYSWANAEQGDASPREKIAVVDSFDKWGWVIGSSCYLDELNRDVRSMQIQFVLTGLCLIAVLVVAVFFSTRHWIGRPLGKALSVTRSAASGDLTVTVKAKNRDEVGQLLAAIDAMCTQLRGMVGEVEEGIGMLASGVYKLATASQNVAEGAGTQSDAAAAMASDVEQMTVSIERVAQLSQEARAMAENSGSVSDGGVMVIGSAIREMSSIAAAVRSSSSAVAQLGNQSQQIVNIVNVIREIADQTNLLALNAAIEAARAGEQGRGFAVVADEVRKLAERTTQSTHEIAAMVTQIQSDAQHAVDSMNTGVIQVEGGVEFANQAGIRIAEIKTGATRVGDAVAGISDTLREQTAVSQDLTHNVERIAQQAEQNHSQALQTSEAAADMELLAGRLSQSIARFRI